MNVPVASRADLESLDGPSLVAAAQPKLRAGAGHGASTNPWIKVLLREPLAHFLLAGGIILALSNLFGHSQLNGIDQKRIVVSAAEIGRLRELWMRQWGHPPSAGQMENLVQDYVREEIYYREALGSGLDKDDTIIRRRLVEKMEYLSQEIASGEPSHADLERYFETNRQKYDLPAEVGFVHIYFSTSQRGAVAFEDARAALTRLASNRNGSTEAATLAATLGDSFMLQTEYPPQTRNQINNLFGGEFAARVLGLQPGAWAGPIKSTYGWHLVRVTQRIAPREATLDEVRNLATIDFKNHCLQTASDNYYARLRQRYKVEIDPGAVALPKAKTQQPADVQPAGNGVGGGTPSDLD